jgi:hypothetical protein
MEVDIRKPRSNQFGIQRPGASNDISTSGNLEDDSDDEEEVALLPPVNGNEDGEGLRRLREARDAMEQQDLQQRRDYGTLSAGEGPNALDIEERISAQPTAVDDFPIYDSDSEDEDDLEEARRVGGWTYRAKVVKSKAKSVGTAVGNFLGAVLPTPTPTEVGGGGSNLGIPSWKQPGEIKRFKAPKGKRKSISTPVHQRTSYRKAETNQSQVSTSRSA